MKLVDKLVPEAVRKLTAYHVPAAEGLVKLDAMENPWPLPAHLREAWLEQLRQVDFNRYPDPSGGELVAHIRRVSGVPDSYGLLLGNGSDELIQMLAQMLGGPGRTFLAPTPTFSMYSLISGITGTLFEGVPLDSSFAPDRDQFIGRIEQTCPACIFLAYPNNPTGNSFDRDFIRQVIDVAPGVVVLDEAYHAFSGQSWLDEVANHDNLLVMRTLSKSGLAGLRLGMLFGHPDWIEQLDKIRLPYNINSLTQASATFCLQNYSEFDRQTRQIVANREAMFARLGQIPQLVAYTSDTNFILVRLSGDADGVWQRLKEQGVLVKNLHEAGGPLENCLRFTVGTEEENELLFDALGASIR